MEPMRAVDAPIASIPRRRVLDSVGSSGDGDLDPGAGLDSEAPHVGLNADPVYMFAHALQQTRHCRASRDRGLRAGEHQGVTPPAPRPQPAEWQAGGFTSPGRHRRQRRAGLHGGDRSLLTISGRDRPERVLSKPNER